MIEPLPDTPLALAAFKKLKPATASALICGALLGMELKLSLAGNWCWYGVDKRNRRRANKVPNMLKPEYWTILVEGMAGYNHAYLTIAPTPEGKYYVAWIGEDVHSNRCLAESTDDIYNAMLLSAMLSKGLLV